MPNFWIKELEHNNVKVSRVYCRSLFLFVLIFFWIQSFFSLFGEIRKQRRRKKTEQNFSYFFDLDKDCIPGEGESYTILDWYVKKYHPTSEKNQLILHGVNDAHPNKKMKGFDIEYISDSFPRLTIFNFYIKYMAQAIYLLVPYTLVNLLLFRWWNIALLRESLYMKLFDLGGRSGLDEYWFHFSHQIYRPLWTYAAEKNGDRLIFYFYSCHISTYKEDKGYSVPPEFWQVMNWPEYFVWNESHASYIKSEIKFDSQIRVVGPIWYQDRSELKLDSFRKPTIVAFDIQPYREFFSYTFASAQRYTYDYKVPVSFLKDIQEVSEEFGYDLAFKRKRDVSMLNKKYISFIGSLLSKKNVLEIEPSISAFRVSRMADIVISMPYTSTAVVAKNCGKVSIFYDPLNKLQDDDRASHGLETIKGKEELVNFISRLKL